MTATFVQNTYTLTVNVVGTGSVALNKTAPYSFGDVVSLTANPGAGWSFSAWSGDLSGSVNPMAILLEWEQDGDCDFCSEYVYFDG